MNFNRQSKYIKHTICLPCNFKMRLSLYYSAYFVITQPKMKNDTSIKSIKGLSEIIEQSYKDDMENTKLQLARLANEQFLMHYAQLDRSASLVQQYRYLYDPPICEYYFKFNAGSQRQQQVKRCIKDTIQQGYQFKINYFTKDQLKEMAAKKQRDITEKQQLSESRRQKRQTFYQNLKNSRKTEFKKEEESPIKSEYSAKTDANIEQSIQDMFFRLQIIGDARDHLKKQWYTWEGSGRQDETKKIIQNWNKNHRVMKELLQMLLEKLNKQIGMIEVFKQLKIGEQSSLLSGFKGSSPVKSEMQKSLGSTRIDRLQKRLSGQQRKVVYRFGSWFNKLLLDQRELEYISKQVR